MAKSKSFKYQICNLHGAARKSKLNSKRVRMNRKSSSQCGASKFIRCSRKKSGVAYCAKRPMRTRKRSGGMSWTI